MYKTLKLTKFNNNNTCLYQFCIENKACNAKVLISELDVTSKHVDSRVVCKEKCFFFGENPILHCSRSNQIS